MSDTFDVRFGFRAEATGKMRNEVRVTSTVPAASGTYEIATDESPMFGGDASAPTPLHYFVAALAGCLMTQVRAFAPRLGVPLDALAVEGTATWLGHRDSRRTYWTEPVSFDLDVHVDSAASTEDVRALVEAAKRGCFVEQTLAKSVKVRHKLHHGKLVACLEDQEA